MTFKHKQLFSIIILMLGCAAPVWDASGEKIVYDIDPTGTSTYVDLGVKEIEGRAVHVSTFHTKVLGFNDTELIYSDPITFLPLRVERNISWPLKKEHIIESYDQMNFTNTITKYKKGKVVNEHLIKEDGPIHNAILLPFFLRTIKDIQIGWSFKLRLLKHFDVTLTSIEEIEVPAGKFKCYHFTSKPPKFEVWITQDELRIPVKIKGGGFGYTMSMKAYSPSTNVGQ